MPNVIHHCFLTRCPYMSGLSLQRLQLMYIFYSVLPYTFFAFSPNIALTPSCSIPSSANDSFTSSYQSPTADLASDSGDGEVPNMILWSPNASSAGPTGSKHQETGLRKKAWKHQLTVHFYPPFPLFLFRAVLWPGATNWCGCWRCGITPVWREELYISVGNQR